MAGPGGSLDPVWPPGRPRAGISPARSPLASLPLTRRLYCLDAAAPSPPPFLPPLPRAGRLSNLEASRAPRLAGLRPSCVSANPSRPASTPHLLWPRGHSLTFAASLSRCCVLLIFFSLLVVISCNVNRPDKFLPFLFAFFSVYVPPRSLCPLFSFCFKSPPPVSPHPRRHRLSYFAFSLFQIPSHPPLSTQGKGNCASTQSIPESLYVLTPRLWVRCLTVENSVTSQHLFLSSREEQ